MSAILRGLAGFRAEGHPRGITSVCSAHPMVLRAALRHAARDSEPVLIEATCNQVNQFGGYTGMKPADFVRLVQELAAEESLPFEQVILGGDHLGPNPWRKESADAAMEKAEAMVAAYVEAGFRKIHLDASMGCAGEPDALDDRTTAGRALRLAQVAERAASAAGREMPLYVIGTEVPPPGGADHVITTLQPTAAAAARETIEVHRSLFSSAGLDDAFSRVIALVVQPGVEFGNENVILYDPDKARDLTGLLQSEQNLVYEAHSTDYQGREPLRQLVRDGFAILKVGPELTFVLRMALYGLDLIAGDLLPDYPVRRLRDVMERLMLEKPGYWQGHYGGGADEQRLQRHYSYSDRIRYYWNQPEAEEAVSFLLKSLAGRKVPATLLRQHLPHLETFASQTFDPEAVLLAAVERSLDDYRYASRAGAV